jgi:hypothetical protein
MENKTANKKIIVVNDASSPESMQIIRHAVGETASTDSTLEAVDYSSVETYVLKPPAQTFFNRRFPQGMPGTILERAGKKYVITEKGMQRRIE